MFRHQQRYFDMGPLLVTTAGLDLLSAGDDIDDDALAAAGADLLFGGNADLLLGAGADLLFGADGDADLLALSNVVSGNDFTDPIEFAGTGLDIIGATNLQGRRQALAKAAMRKRGINLQALMAAKKKANAQRRLQNLAGMGIQPTLAVETGYTKARTFPFGLQADGVTLAGAAGSVTRRPQTPIKIARLVIPSSIAGAFVITDLKVGKDSQFVGSDPIPAETFIPTAVGVELKGDTANVGHDVTVAFTNISGAPQQFRAALIGPAVE
jgi:hypothetical protein